MAVAEIFFLFLHAKRQFEFLLIKITAQNAIVPYYTHEPNDEKEEFSICRTCLFSNNDIHMNMNKKNYFMKMSTVMYFFYLKK